MQLPNHPITQLPNSVASYYDRLARWTKLAGLVGYGGGRGSLLVHRSLADPLAGGRATPTRLNTLIEAAVAQRLPRGMPPRVLDAGCGFGGVMIDLVARFGGSAVGLTLSRAQAREARQAAGRAGLSGRVDVLVRTYDDPPVGPFDLIVAVESLAHSPDPARSLDALCSCLGPGGLLIVVDDMPEPGAEGSGDLARFKAGWHCPVLWSLDRYHTALHALGLKVEVEDLTAACRPRELAAIERLEWWNRVLRASVPLEAWRATLASYAGGLALERLYRHGLMRYALVIATRATGTTRV